MLGTNVCLRRRAAQMLGTNVGHKSSVSRSIAKGVHGYPFAPLTRAPLGRSVMLPSVALLSSAVEGAGVWLSPVVAGCHWWW
jgi:hypothetical protein